MVTLPRLAPICTPDTGVEDVGEQLLELEQAGRAQRVRGEAGAVGRLGRRRRAPAPAAAGPAPLPRCGPHSSTVRTDQPSARGLAGQPLLQRAVRCAEQGPGVTGRQLAVGQQVLHGRRQAEQAQRVGDRRAALADALGDVVVGELEVLDQLLVGRRLLQRGEVLAVEVLDQRLLDGAHVVGGADDGRHRRSARPDGPPASGARRR